MQSVSKTTIVIFKAVNSLLRLLSIKKSIFLILCVVLAIFLGGRGSGGQAIADKTTTDEWRQCKRGRRQSPIDIRTESLIFDPSLSPVRIHGANQPVRFLLFLPHTTIGPLVMHTGIVNTLFSSNRFMRA